MAEEWSKREYARFDTPEELAAYKREQYALAIKRLEDHGMKDDPPEFMLLFTHIADETEDSYKTNHEAIIAATPNLARGWLQSLSIACKEVIKDTPYQIIGRYLP